MSSLHVSRQQWRRRHWSTAIILPFRFYSIIIAHGRCSTSSHRELGDKGFPAFKLFNLCSDFNHSVMRFAISVSLLLLQILSVDSFHSHSNWLARKSHHLLQRRQPGGLPAASASVAATGSSTAPLKLGRKEKLAQLRKEGGPLTILTPFGALNPFGLYYGVVSVCKST